MSHIRPVNESPRFPQAARGDLNALAKAIDDLKRQLTVLFYEYGFAINLVIKNFPSISADRGDAAVTLTVRVDEGIQMFETVLTANRIVTLSTAGAVNGDVFRVVRTGLGAFTLDVGGLKTVPSATAAFVEVGYDGAAWKLIGYGPL